MNREEAIEQIKWYFKEDDGIAADDVTKRAINMAIEALKNERPKGHWVKKWSGNGWNEDWDYICSVCGKKYEKAGSVLYHASYCPNCGVDMRGEDE